MDRKGPEDGSSSQNVKIIHSVSFSKECRVFFTDGSEIVLHSAVAASLELSSGKELTEIDIEKMESRSALLNAERLSINMLSRYPHTRQSLGLKLLKKGFAKSVVERVLIRLEETGYINDAEYARSWLQARMERHPEGKRASLAGLLGRGVSAAVAEEIVEEMITPEAEFECAIRFLERKGSHKSMAFGVEDPGLLYKKLFSRGFSGNIINAIIREYGEL